MLVCSGADMPQKILASRSWPINHRMVFTTESLLTSGNPRQRLCILKKLRLIEFLLTSLVRKLWNLRRYCMHWTAVWQWYIRRAAVRSNWCAIRTKSVTEWLHTRSYKTRSVLQSCEAPRTSPSWPPPGPRAAVCPPGGPTRQATAALRRGQHCEVCVSASTFHRPLDWTFPLLNYSLTELFLDWTFPLLSYSLTERFLDWPIPWLN